eukprot:2663815-Pleurochrysis_carterae.AAC.1
MYENSAQHPLGMQEAKKIPQCQALWYIVLARNIQGRFPECVQRASTKSTAANKSSHGISSLLPFRLLTRACLSPSILGQPVFGPA